MLLSLSLSLRLRLHTPNHHRAERDAVASPCSTPRRVLPLFARRALRCPGQPPPLNLVAPLRVARLFRCRLCVRRRPFPRVPSPREKRIGGPPACSQLGRLRDRGGRVSRAWRLRWIHLDLKMMVNPNHL